MKFGLEDVTYQKLIKTFSKYNEIDEVLIYGSRALGTYKNGSDIDLTIKGECFKFSQLSQILNDLEELTLPYGFDVSCYSKLTNEALKEHIDRVGKVFYTRLPEGAWHREK